MNKVSFPELKLIPIGSLLRHYRIEAKRQGEFLVAAKCPLPTHTSAETGTFKVSVKENWWTCFSQSCRAALKKNGGDVIDFFRLMENLDPLPAAKRLAELFVINQNAPRSAERNGFADPQLKNKPLGFVLQDLNPCHPMIQSRGISPATATEWGVGFFPGKGSMANRVVFPLQEDGVHVGYCGRAVEGEPKWLMGKGVRRTFLYGLERCDPAKVLILCESPWAVLWFFQHGHQCAAILGSDLTAEQERRLEPFGTIILAMDADEKGKEAAEKISARLRKNHKVIKSCLKE